MTSLREAARGLLRYPLRSLLALLGLVVGVASITGTLALLRASHRLAIASLERYGAVDVVRLDSPDGVWREGHWSFIGKRATLVEGDLARIRALVPGLRETSKTVPLSSRPIRSGAVSRDASVEGADANAPDFTPGHVSFGRFFSEEEAAAAQRVVVLSEALAEELFPHAAASLGAEVLVGGFRATVVGVFEMPKDDSGEGPKVCLVPFRTALERFGAPPEDVTLLLRAGDTRKLREVEKALEAVTPHLHEGIGATSYRVDSQRESLEEVEGQTRMEATLLGGVAALAMIVAAGGILNTLLVGVRERTREIGTRRALGARRSAIRAQFLLEAVALSVPGAALGLGGGVLLARGLGALFAAGLKNPSLLEVRVEGADLLAAGLVALTVAVAAGVGPAWVAANVEPAEALRYE